MLCLGILYFFSARKQKYETIYFNAFKRNRQLMENMDVSENSGTPKSSILIGFSIINHPFWGTPIFGNTHIQNKTDLLMLALFRHRKAPVKRQKLFFVSLRNAYIQQLKLNNRPPQPHNESHANATFIIYLHDLPTSILIARYGIFEIVPAWVSSVPEILEVFN